MYPSQTQCQYDCNHIKNNPCCIKDDVLKLTNCTSWKNQVNKTVAKTITNLRLSYFESEIVLPGNLREEFPNLEKLNIIGAKSTIESEEATDQQKWSKKLTLLEIHNIKGPLTLPNFANSNIKELQFNGCDNLTDISNISSLTKLEKLIFYRVNGLKSIPSGTFKENGKLKELVISSSFRKRPLALTEDSFEGLINLQALEVVDTFEITNLPPHLFKHCPNLQDITWTLTPNVTFPRHFFPPTLRKFYLNNYLTCSSKNHVEFNHESFENVTKENLKELKIMCTSHGYEDLIGNFASKFVNLERLELDNNKITILKNANDIPKTVKFLNLKNNPLVCNCMTNRSIRDLKLRFEKIIGSSSFEYKNEILKNETCSSDLEFSCNVTPANITIVSIIVLLVLIIIVSSVLYSRRYQKHHPKFPPDSDLIYDAFIISHDNDKDILINILTELHKNYNIVTPHDYLLGIQEFENLFKHISTSKRIIMILSEDFFTSTNETVDLKSCLTEALTHYSKR